MGFKIPYDSGTPLNNDNMDYLIDNFVFRILWSRWEENH